MVDFLKTLRRIAGRLFGKVSTIGHLDQLDGGKISGWAFLPSMPSHRVRLQVFVDDDLVTEGVADLYRSDLVERGFGDGLCGFVFALPEDRLDDRHHVIDVVNASTGERLGSHTRIYRLIPYERQKRPVRQYLFNDTLYELSSGPVLDALDHYRNIGWRQGLNPHPLFDVKRYMRLQKLACDVEPLAHFEREGQYTGASIHALLDGEQEWGSIDPRRREHPVFAYLERRTPGQKEPSPFFSDTDYGARYPGVVDVGFQPLVHYLSYGWREGRRPHADFDPKVFASLAHLDKDIEPYGYLVDWLRACEARGRADHPLVSIIVLNLDKAVLTLQCLYFLKQNPSAIETEIIVVDNGSKDEDFALLSRHACGAKIVRVGVNRGFGEGNNIGAEQACGRYLVFMNNDVFVKDGWLEPLVDVVEADASVGAVGAKLLYPDGRLQEAGAMLSVCGTAVQRGKFLDPRSSIFNRTQPVDYCSAALLLVRAEAFHSVLGFDLSWDPAYYEDADLSFKLRTIGLKTVYAHRSEAFHLEHATSSDEKMRDFLRNIVATNRLKFVQRWTQDNPPPFHREPGIALDQRPSRRRPGPSLALFTPFPLTPGGGERYLLTIAAGLGASRRCVLFTQDRYSRVRLLTLARELGLDLDHVELAMIDEVGRHERFDAFVCMSNELLPPVGPIASRNFYHCQFPFPMAAEHHGSRWAYLDEYDAIVVNSKFTAHHYQLGLERMGLAAKPVSVVPPPVPQMTRASVDRRADAPIRILNVGRFASNGHCKRQDVMIDLFRLLLKRVEHPLELHLAGVVGLDLSARDYLDRLLAMGRDLPVFFHPNASIEQLDVLYADASVYWHLTGFGQDMAKLPHLFEHFGIAIVEAMSAGVVPVAYRGGGPAEIISSGRDGFLVDTSADVVAHTAALLANPKKMTQMSAAASRRAADFTPEMFCARIGNLIDGTGERRDVASFLHAAQ